MCYIKIQNLSFSYQAQKPILTNFSASIELGSKIAITAPSGYGKTTLLLLLAGLLKPQEGTILFPPSCKKVSMVFQENRLLPSINILKNIKLVNPRLSEYAILTLLKKTGLSSYALKKPAYLSGGEQRRVAIVRALAADYDLLLLDEPFTGLDIDTKKHMIDFIEEQANNKTIVLVSHNPEDFIGYQIIPIFTSNLSYHKF